MISVFSKVIAVTIYDPQSHIWDFVVQHNKVYHYITMFKDLVLYWI